MENITIRPALASDALVIGNAVVEAIGAENCEELGRGRYTVQQAREFFSAMAARPDTQYSYRNTLVAENTSGNVVGVCVAYDGARLHELREVFFRFAVDFMGINPLEVTDETDAGEFYLDSLWVAPEFRGAGIASGLIKATAERAGASGKPLGLLCEPENAVASRLYECVGFRKVGTRLFMGIPMNHMKMA